ncbi:hypothetical protein BaRGS_00033920 [Batillaria attramentaria]|uniref:PiggyBac transposable element-derived protein domain-containing protein n=1 Tax=Batillaria attramentaria TaxID=370345 RepID=A0ABD0JIP6_9CAEN
MAELDDPVSDGSDFELDYDAELEEVADIELFDDVEHIAAQIFGDGDEEELDFAGFLGGWVTDPANFQPRQVRDYRRQCQVNANLPENPKPVDFFYLFWDDTMWRRLLVETNRYHDQQVRQKGVAPSAPTWKPITNEEMKTFIGLILMMGIIRLPQRNDYWRIGEDCWLAHTNFNKAMSRNRFNDIWRYLHTQDNMAPAGEDRLIKLRWFLNRLCDKYQHVYTPGPTYSVDETMVKYKGRLMFRQYMPMKPTKWGIKVWCLAESTTGYVANFQVYTGKEGRAPERGLGHRVVTDMTVPLQGTQAQVYFDNFFTSEKLLTDLANLNIQACGTVRQDRCHDVPPRILPKTKKRPTGVVLERHQFRVGQNDTCTFSHWQDTKPVLVMSNFHDPRAMGQVRRTTRDAAAGDNRPQRRYIAVPACLADYQSHMKGVDLADQMTGYYTLNHRSWKWWRRLFSTSFWSASTTLSWCVRRPTLMRPQRRSSTSSKLWHTGW